MSAAQRGSGGVPTLKVEEAAQQQTGDAPASLVDVREMNEYLELRAESSALLPLSELGTRFTELPKDGSLMLVCRSGGRSAKAAAFLMQQGFSDVSSVEGGMIAWQRAGLPTRSGPLDPGEGDL